MGPASVSGMTTAPTSISSRATDKGGDDCSNPNWSHDSADLIPQDRRRAFAIGPELALIAKRLSMVASSGDHSTPLLKRHPSTRWDHEDAARPRARGRNFRWFLDKAKTAQAVLARHLLGCDGVGLGYLLPYSVRLQRLGGPLGGWRRSHQQGQPAGSGQQLLGSFCFFKFAIWSAASSLTAFRTASRIRALVTRPR
jgi:hypothetical protein